MSIALLLALAAQSVTVPPFNAVALRDGGEVVIRYAPAARVTVIRGATATPIRVEGGRLLIQHCHRGCPRGERLRVEVATPVLNAVSVSDGGLLQVLPGFPRQETLAAAVSSGGMIDVRALAAEQVSASIAHGGLIFTRPGARLDARISQGGGITYWGTPAVHSAISQGGGVARGDPADLERPFNEIFAVPGQPGAIPPIPPVPSLAH